MSAEVTNHYDLLIGLAWPVTVLLAIVILRTALVRLLDKDEVSFQIPNGPVIKLSKNEAAETLSGLFNDFLATYEHLINDYEKEVYRRILSTKTPPMVDDMIPDFSRDNRKHKGCLRALRGIGLIRPEDDKEWQNKSRIIVTKFGNSLNKYLTSRF